MGKENKKLRNSKNNTLREELTRDPDLMLLIERAVIRCINDDVAVTINGIAREGANKSYGTRAFTGNPLILND